MISLPRLQSIPESNLRLIPPPLFAPFVDLTVTESAKRPRDYNDDLLEYLSDHYARDIGAMCVICHQGPDGLPFAQMVCCKQQKARICIPCATQHVMTRAGENSGKPARCTYDRSTGTYKLDVYIKCPHCNTAKFQIEPIDSFEFNSYRHLFRVLTETENKKRLVTDPGSSKLSCGTCFGTHSTDREAFDCSTVTVKCPSDKGCWKNLRLAWTKSIEEQLRAHLDSDQCHGRMTCLDCSGASNKCNPSIPITNLAAHNKLHQQMTLIAVLHAGLPTPVTDPMKLAFWSSVCAIFSPYHSKKTPIGGNDDVIPYIAKFGSKRAYLNPQYTEVMDLFLNGHIRPYLRQINGNVTVESKVFSAFFHSAYNVWINEEPDMSEDS